MKAMSERRVYATKIAFTKAEFEDLEKLVISRDQPVATTARECILVLIRRAKEQGVIK